MSEHRPHPDPTEAPLEPLYTHPASPFLHTDTSAPAHVEMQALPPVQSTWVTYRTQIEFGLAMLAYLMVLVGSITLLQANPGAKWRYVVAVLPLVPAALTLWIFVRALSRYSGYNERSRRFIRWMISHGWREVPAAPRRTPHFHINLQPDARKMSTTRALMSAYLSYLYRCGEKRVYGQIVTFESRRGEQMFERYGFKVLNRAEITKYKAFYPQSVYLSTVIKNLETAEPLRVTSRSRSI